MNEGIYFYGVENEHKNKLEAQGPFIAHLITNSKQFSQKNIDVCETLLPPFPNILRIGLEYMETNNLFTKHQHGFRKGHSCVTQLIEVIEDWTKELDQQNSVDAIYLDFQKAFDTVPHKRLLNKLKGYGITGKLHKWLCNFLTERRQRVVLNGEESEWSSVTSGIPQGSVLGPILFLLYINDLPDVVKSIVKIFADDTKIYARVNNDEEHKILQEDLDNLMKWSDDWLLKFNKSKCKHLHIGRDTNKTYTIDGENINLTTEEKDLGVTVDHQLKFQKHIGEQVKKANQKLGIIHRSFSYMDEEMFLTLYKSLVRPHLEYGCCVWAVIYKKEAVQLENVQRRATRMIPQIRHLSYSERLKHLGLPSLQYRRLRADTIEVFKIMNNIDIVDKTKLFPPSISTNTRGHHQRIFKQHSRTNIRKQSFSQRVVNTWNSLPTEVVSATSLNIFKNRLNDYWKHLPIKFSPDCYGPEADRRRTYQDGSERQRLH